MATPKRLLHDKFVILLMLVCILLMLFSVFLVLLRVDTGQPIAIVRYKTSLGVAGFERGASTQLYSFVYMALISGVGGVVLARRIYRLRRTLAVTLLSLTVVVLIFNIIVSNALLNLQ